MLRNYLKIAWRNLLRQKLFSFLNLLGLAIGIAACLLILEYVQFERGFVSFNNSLRANVFASFKLFDVDSGANLG